MGAAPVTDLNHFICTLGEAEIHNLTPKSQYNTINEFFDYQAEHNGDQFAIAIPERKLKHHPNHASFLGSHKPDYVEDSNGQGPEKVSYGRPSRQGSKGWGYALPEKDWAKDLNEKGVVPENGHEPSEWSVHFYTFQDLLDYSLRLALNLECVFRGSKDWSSQQLRQTLNLPDTVKHTKCMGLLGRSDRAFLFMWLGLMRLGVSVLIIMPSCSPEGLYRLCRQCNVDRVFYDDALLEYQAVASTLFQRPDVSFQMHRYSSKEITDLIPRMSIPTAQPIPCSKDKGKTHSKSIAYLHHTSGTSGLPKPVPYSHRAACGALPILNGRDTITFTTTPLFTGGIADCFRTWTSSATICLAPDDGHPLTAEIIVECFSQMQERYRLFRNGLPNPDPKSMYFSCVPMIAQMLSQTSIGLAFLRTMDIVGVGGATLPKDDGDTLISKGINLVSRFGSAECSFILSTHRHYKVDKEWEYFRVPQAVPYLKFEPLSDGSGRSELVIMKGWPQMAKTNRDDGSWATSDLFEPHPSIKNAWKIVSRRDAQITLITGKKFDPVGIEEAMKRHPLIQDAFVFGNGRVYPGAIIIKSQEAISLKDDEVSDTIWPYIESLNENGPAQAKIFKDMLVIKPNTHALAKTAKGTTRRQRSEQDYDADISNAYKSDLILSKGEVSLEMVMGIVKQAIGNPTELQYDSEFRAHHIDSVQATRIQSRLNSAFSDTKCFPWNLVYQCGSVRALTKYIKAVQNGHTPDDDENETQRMISIVEEFGNTLKDETTEASSFYDFIEDLDETIVITGVTGTLGVNIVSLLRSIHASKKAVRIVCLVRARNDDEARKRVEEVVRYHNIHQDLVSTTTIIEYRAVKLEQTELGLSRDVLDDLRKYGTTIIHAAWEVNFSIPLKDFCEQFQGLRNLINLSLSGKRPMHLVFCSSTASVANAAIDKINENTIIEGIDNNPSHAGPLGYSKSKWVAEAICSLACRKTRANISVLRIGQLSGNTVNGTWNEKEAWPLMLSAGGPGSLNSLPKLNLPLSWLPVDIAATGVIDIAFRKTSTSALVSPPAQHEAVVFHLVNDSTLEFGEWLAQAENPEGLEDQHPARSLLGFWKAMDKRMKEDLTVNPSFSLLRTRQVSPTMDSFDGIDKQSAEKIWQWVQTLPKRWEDE
ncbi:hypothetical protein EYC84_000419 [Monilinia fructicola]|uniref:Carrier domain-containing protein n=1 Tax=Monilinia fructicola TaxID=38448 RepID=A0A5M9JSL4_MONFR|nr:hypothetical protein EYC84_000419 [Monilinia fructicola]